MDGRSEILSWMSRWSLPILATMAFPVLLTHKSEFPIVLDRYSLDYIILLILYSLNVGLFWRKSCSQVSYTSLINRISHRQLFSLVIVALSVIFLADLAGIDAPKSVVDWVNLVFLLSILVQVEASRKHTIFLSSNLALLTSSLVVAVILVEWVFVLFMVQTRTPTNMQEFLQLMSPRWPHPISVVKPAGTFRILGVSDSFGEAGGTASNYHYLLEEILRRDASPGIEMVNVSVSGTQPLHQLNILRFAMRYAPDIVVHAFFVGNDFGSHTGPMEEMVGKGSIGIPPRPETSWRYRPRYLTIRRRIEGLVTEFMEKRRREAELISGIASRKGSFSKTTYATIQFNRMQGWAKPTDKDVGRMKEIFPVLDAIRSAVEESGARYVMVIHPDETQLNDQLRQEIMETFDVAEGEYDFDLPSRLLGSYCVSREILCLDLLHVFRQNIKQRELYLLRNTHYNEAGNELAALSIGKFLHDKQLLPTISRSSPVHMKVTHKPDSPGR